jgi:hypothetical protein
MTGIDSIGAESGMISPSEPGGKRINAKRLKKNINDSIALLALLIWYTLRSLHHKPANKEIKACCRKFPFNSMR